MQPHSLLSFRFAAFVTEQVGVLSFYRSRQLREPALVVDHLQVLNVVSDVAGTPQREAVV